jgi:hypothetical protein
MLIMRTANNTLLAVRRLAFHSHDICIMLFNLANIKNKVNKKGIPLLHRGYLIFFVFQFQLIFVRLF